MVARTNTLKGKDRKWYGILLGGVHAWFGRFIILFALMDIYLGLDLFCVSIAAFVGYSILIGVILAVFVPFELMRWLSPWSAAFGGVGFSFQQGHERDDEGNSFPLPHEVLLAYNLYHTQDVPYGVELATVGPSVWKELVQNRAEKATPRWIKLVMWVFAGICGVVIVGLFLLVLVELAIQDVDSPTPYRPGCFIGQSYTAV